jgi:ABC-2 type transport system ATP-binding protein
MSSDNRAPATEHAPAVVLRNLEKRFGAFVAVNRISLEVGRGEIFGFLGPNGAGKSTTIRMLCGILTPTSGEGSVAGYDVKTQPELIKQHIGYMSQKFSLYEDLTVEENLDFYGGIYGLSGEKREERKAWVLKMAGLEQHRNERTGLLPVGWKQRLALGSAVLHEPPILFLDEPTSGVDPISRRRFWELIYELSSRGVTVFVTTHYMEEAEYCQRLGLIYRGELIALGTPDDLKARFMTATVLEIVADPAHEAMDVVAAVKGVREAAVFGTTVHAVIPHDSDATIESIAAALTAAGFAKSGVAGAQQRTLTSIRAIKPSLEDVFVSLVEERDAREAPLQEVRA